MKSHKIIAGVFSAAVAVASAGALTVQPAAAHQVYGLADSGPMLSGMTFRFEEARAVEPASAFQMAYRKSRKGWKGGNRGGNKGNVQKPANCWQITHPNPTVQKKLRIMCERNKR